MTTLAIAAFGVPLGIALSRIQRDSVVLRLESEASHVIAVVPDERLAGAAAGLPTQLPSQFPVGEGQRMTVAMYSASGRRLGGIGPGRSQLAATATRTGGQRVGVERGQLAVTLSLLGDRPSRAAVRVALPMSAVNEEQQENDLEMAGLAVLVLLLAAGAAALAGRRMNRPLDALAQQAERLGDGDFTVRAGRSGLREVDAVGAAMDATARRIDELLSRERSFSANASHQLRTPLSALRLRLESAAVIPGAEVATVVREAVAELDRLDATVNRLLALARDVDQPVGAVDLAQVLLDGQRRWAPLCRRQDRVLLVEPPPAPIVVRGSAASLEHVLDVLVDNALQHGAGTIRLTARAVGEGAALDVADEGPGVPGDTGKIFRRRSEEARGHGIGLALARALMEADGARLELTSPGPAPVFSLLFPGREREAGDPAGGSRQRAADGAGDRVAAADGAGR